MYEIEAKVHLTGTDLKRLKRELPKIARRKGKVVNIDRYYANPKRFYLRIRQRNKKGLLNLKTKKREQGIELNQEIELPITSVQKFHSLLKKLNIPLYAMKTKESELYGLGDMQIELNKITKLGYFLEIEYIVKSKAEIPKAKKALRDVFWKLGFRPSDFENKYYLELLAENMKP